MIWKCKANKPFPPKLLWPWCFTATIVTLTKTPCFSRPRCISRPSLTGGRESHPLLNNYLQHVSTTRQKSNCEVQRIREETPAASLRGSLSRAPQQVLRYKEVEGARYIGRSVSVMELSWDGG